MTEVNSNYETSQNQNMNKGGRKKGQPRKWNDLPIDPMSKGFQAHTADYIVGNTPLLWTSLSPGQLFCRNESGKNLYVKLNDGRAVSLDTKSNMDIKPDLRGQLSVWVVTGFNSVTPSQNS